MCSIRHTFCVCALSDMSPFSEETTPKKFRAWRAARSSFFVDALVLELLEPDGIDPYALSAIAAAAREMWQTLHSPPSIAEFLVAARKHQQRLDGGPRCHEGAGRMRFQTARQNC